MNDEKKKNGEKWHQVSLVKEAWENESGGTEIRRNYGVVKKRAWWRKKKYREKLFSLRGGSTHRYVLPTQFSPKTIKKLNWKKTSYHCYKASSEGKVKLALKLFDETTEWILLRHVGQLLPWVDWIPRFLGFVFWFISKFLSKCSLQLTLFNLNFLICFNAIKCGCLFLLWLRWFMIKLLQLARKNTMFQAEDFQYW